MVSGPRLVAGVNVQGIELAAISQESSLQVKRHSSRKKIRE
jgi:hypothetical protein